MNMFVMDAAPNPSQTGSLVPFGGRSGGVLDTKVNAPSTGCHRHHGGALKREEAGRLQRRWVRPTGLSWTFVDGRFVGHGMERPEVLA